MVEKIKSFYRGLIPQYIRKPIRDFRLEKEFHFDCEIEFYGAYKVILKHLGVTKILYPKRKMLNWSHGWYSDFFMDNAKYAYMACCYKYYNEPGRFNFVTRKSQENFLKERGYQNTKAIGMPIVYIPKESKVKRIPNSLLIMPGHSLESQKLETFEDEYVKLINSFKNDFAKVVVCIHPACIKNNQWISTLKAESFEIVNGFELSNTNTFYGIRDLMSQFEFMTTNACGSHIMYASYFGCKVSIMGKEPTYSVSVYNEEPNWANDPDKGPILESYEKVRLSNYKIHYPSLFVKHPRFAKENIELANYELGVDCKISTHQFNKVVKNHFEK